MLSYADHISLLTFANYDEKSLILHINTCDAMALKLHKTLFVLQPCESHKAMSNDKSTTVTITTIDADSGASEKSKHEKDDKIQDNISEHSKESNADARIIKRLQYPLAVVDAVSSAMFNSARNAALTMVYNTLHSADDLVSGFLNERVVEWKNGSLIVAFIDRFEKWVLNIAQIMPLKYLNLLYVETGRTMIYLYISNMIHFHKHAKVMLSAAGIERMDSDLSALYSWMTHSNATVREYSDGERNLLQTLKNFLLCDKDMALQAYAHAISSMGLQYSLHIYDLIRLIMKFRLDLPPKNRKSLLALCGEYLQQLQKAVANDPTLICGSSNQKRAFQDVSLFDRLCPKVGVEHCTGKKWRVEMLADLAAMRMTISLLVTQTCDEARAIRRAFMVLPDHNTQIVTAALTVSTRSENRNSEVDSEVDASHVEQKVSGIEESGSDRILEFQQRIDNLTLEEKPITGNDSKAVVANATNTVVNTKGKRKPPRPPPPPMQPMKNAVKQPVLVEKVSAVAKSDSVESVDTIKAAPPKPMKPPKPTKPSNVTIPQAVNISVGNSDFAESSVSPTNALRQLLEAANKEIMPGANSE